MTDKTRREFLKNLGKGAGTTLLTAGIVSSQKPQQRTVKKKVQTVKKVQKLGSEAKAYRKFLTQSLSREQYGRIPLTAFKWGGYKENLTGPKINEAREAFKELTAKKGTKSKYPGRWSAGFANTILKSQHEIPEEERTSHKKVLQRESELKTSARSLLATEKRTERRQNKPKQVTKRGIYEKIKSKLRKFKPRSGFGGPRPRKVGIGNQDPSRVSGYHY